MPMRTDAITIFNHALEWVLPRDAVKRELLEREFSGRLWVVAIGKASWQMASAAYEVLSAKVHKGFVITKYNHSKGPIGDFEIYEAGHPIVDENSVSATNKVLEGLAEIAQKDTVIFLVSGGGSALFESPMPGVTLEDIADVTEQLLKCGADIVDINTLRKRLSSVKGGKFATQCKGAKILTLALSDVLGDRLDTIASGPAYPDHTTTADVRRIIDQYGLVFKEHIVKALNAELPKSLENCETVVIGSVTGLCKEAERVAQAMGYQAYILSTDVASEAREMGRLMASIGQSIVNGTSSYISPCAIILGGETIVTVRGSGLGGRNQELALAAAIGIKGLEHLVIMSVGSDGTDGPTDAAGGLVDGKSVQRMLNQGVNPEAYLMNNDAYHALKASDDLIVTGPTGTNVNDLMVLLYRVDESV